MRCTPMSDTTTVHDQYYEMANAPVNRIIPKLAVPTIISMLVTSIYNMADTFFVSQLGTSASGAIGIVFSAMAIIQALSFMVGMGSGNYIARSIGAGKRQLAEQVASVAFFTGLIVGLLIAILGNLSLRNVVFFLGATETIAPFAQDYAHYIFLAAPFMVTSFIMNNLLRFQGKALFGHGRYHYRRNPEYDPGSYLYLQSGTWNFRCSIGDCSVAGDQFLHSTFYVQYKKRMYHDPSEEFSSNLKYLQKCDLRRYSIPWPSGDRQCGNHHHECNGSSLRRRSNRCHVYRPVVS